MYTVGYSVTLDLVVDSYNRSILLNQGKIIQLIDNASIAGDFTILNKTIHKFSDGGGVTAIYLLSESHLSIHTWPEHNMLCLDIFSCGPKENIIKARDYIIKRFEPIAINIREFERKV